MRAAGHVSRRSLRLPTNDIPTLQGEERARFAEHGVVGADLLSYLIEHNNSLIESLALDEVEGPT